MILLVLSQLCQAVRTKLKKPYLTVYMYVILLYVSRLPTLLHYYMLYVYSVVYSQLNLFTYTLYSVILYTYKQLTNCLYSVISSQNYLFTYSVVCVIIRYTYM